MEGMRLALAHHALLGDGLLWHGDRWWWTDAPAATLHAWREGGAAPAAWRLPDRAGSAAFCRSGRLLVGLAKWLCFADPPAPARAGKAPRQPALQPVAAVDPAEPRTRVADGRTHRRGQFVFGTRNDAPEPRAIGSFYQYSQAHGLRRLALPAATVAGSLWFSPDGATMYFSTGERAILRCDYDADGARVAGVRPFAAPSDGVPHGAAVDSEGCVWSAERGSGRLVRHAPDGGRMATWTLPAPDLARPAFGGTALDRLMVASADGRLFALDAPGVPGIADTPFDDGLPDR
jgi:L-arabinonolactonase